MKYLCLLSLSACGALAATAAELRPHSGLKPLLYTNAPAALPNYVSGAQWGTEGSQLTSMQVPLTPEESAKHIVLAEGFEAKLWAADPQIKKPITMTWDERGRLWIAETVDYPNELQPEGKGRDRIVICEDRDHDGRAETFTVFAEGLSIPTGMVHANGGLIVIESGRTLFLRDTNGDDKADAKTVLFEGWGMGDTHATASNLRYGHDNWIWGVVGYSGFRGTVGSKYHEFGMGVFRFTPDGKHMEFIRSSNNNTWGLGFSEEGLVFGSTANNNASWYMPMANRYYESVRGWSASRMETIADSQAFHPIAKNIRQVDAHGRYTAGAGHALYTARGFPKSYWNKIAFVTEPTGHLIGHFKLQGNAADFRAVNQKSFLASDDEWFAPIMAEVGPDGALWVLDWYNYIIQHNPTPRGFKTGKGNAYETPLRDKRHGRIYRVTHKDGAFPLRGPLDVKAPSELLASLSSDNMLTRLQAQRLLVERQNRDVVQALCGLVRDTRVDELNLNPGALHALWTLHGLGAIQSGTGTAYETAVQALRHPSSAVRRAAVQVIPRNEFTEKAMFDTGLLLVPDGQTRLAVLLAFSEFQPSLRIGQAVYAALQNSGNAEDRWLRDAIIAAGSRHLDGFLHQGLLADKSASSMGPPGWSAVQTIVAHYAASLPANIAHDVIAHLKNSEASKADAVLDGIVAGWGEAAAPRHDKTDRGEIRETLATLEPASQQRLLVLIRKWGFIEEFKAEKTEAVAKLLAELGLGTASEAAKAAAARNLMGLEDTPESVKVVAGLIKPTTPPAQSTALIQAIGLSKRNEAANELLAAWKQMTPSARRATTSTLLRRPPWAHQLLAAVERGAIHRNDLARDHWSQLRSHSDRTVADRASKAQAGAPSTQNAPAMEAVVARLMPVASRKGDVQRGREVFEKNCLICHAVNAQGARVGPDLTGIGARPKADVLLDILDPNRSVEANYRLWNVTTKSGESYAGRLDSESATAIEMLDTAGQKHVLQRSAIATMEASNLSLMPGGFEQLPEEDLASLLEYLAAQANHAAPGR